MTRSLCGALTAGLLAVGLTACGSSGGGAPSVHALPLGPHGVGRAVRDVADPTACADIRLWLADNDPGGGSTMPAGSYTINGYAFTLVSSYTNTYYYPAIGDTETIDTFDFSQAGTHYQGTVTTSSVKGTTSYHCTSPGW